MEDKLIWKHPITIMKKLKQFDQKHLEFKEVSPSVHLEDLSPASNL